MFSTKIIQEIKRFRENSSGNIAMMTAILGTALFTSAGVAIDYSRAYSVRSEMYNALDAAVLAVGQELMDGKKNEPQYRETFEDFFYANIAGRGRSEDDFQIVEFTANPVSGEVRAVTKAQIGASMMRIAGIETLEMTSEASAVFSIGDVEVAMMLDVTGSMKGQKLTDLKSAAKDAIDILLPNNSTNGVRIGLVPYASSINAGVYASRVTEGNETQVAGTGSFVTSINVPTTRCVTGRGGAEAVTDASYQDAPLGSDDRTVNPEKSYHGCPVDAKIQPLTNDRSELKRQIGKYAAKGYTAGHLGVAWSYYLLSENWRDLFNSPNKPARYSDDVKKIAILMTDGIFNTAFEGIGNNSPFGENQTVSSENAKALCEDMKKQKAGNDGIIVYSVAFQAPSSAQQMLKTCANDDTADQTFYFSADNGEELRDAFREIAADITKLRISR